MGLVRSGLLVLACCAVLAGDASASFPGRNGVIVYTSTLVPAPASGVVELELGPRVVRRSLTARTGISGLLPAESPDGRSIAFVRDGHVYVTRSEGSEVRDFGRGTRPSWSPDGDELAFSGVDDYTTVFVADAINGKRRRLGYGVNPSWSPDGSRIAFVKWDGLGIVNADGSGYRIVWPQQMSDWSQLDAPAWSPDGRRIAISTVSDLFEGDAYSAGLVVIEVATGSSFAFREWARHPSWSPSGTSLVYVRTRGRKSSKEVVLLDAERRSRSVLATIPYSPQCEFGLGRGGLALGASFAPRENRIAFAAAVRRNGRCRVSIGLVAPGARARIVHSEPGGSRPAGFLDDEIQEAGPRWRRDGRAVWLGLERRTLVPDLYVRREDGSGLRRLTSTPAAEQDPRFSADGRRLVFVRGTRGRDGVIWIADARGRGARAIGPGSYPAWSPSGRRIAFTRKDSLYTVSARGGRPTLIARRPAAMPSWSPDGRLIAFARAGVAVERDPSEAARSAGIFTIDVRTRRLRRFTSDGLFPNWSPDGKLVAYSRWEIGPSEADQWEEHEYPFLRLVSREGMSVDPGDPYLYAHDVAWAPSGDRLVSSWVGASLFRIRPPLLASRGAGPVGYVDIPNRLGIDTEERDPDWQP
jgi:Tol biopolymer transport system component